MPDSLRPADLERMEQWVQRARAFDPSTSPNPWAAETAWAAAYADDVPRLIAEIRRLRGDWGRRR